MWFKVEDKLHEHTKARKAGKAAMGVWVLSGSWSADNNRGGFVPNHVLTRWGTKADAARLVAAGLWRDGFDGDEIGYWFHEWNERNPSSEDASLIAKKKGNGGKEGNHRRWHIAKGVVSPTCDYCRGLA